MIWPETLKNSLTTLLSGVGALAHLQIQKTADGQGKALSYGNKALPGKANRYGQPGLTHGNIAVFIGQHDFHPPIQAAIGGRVIAGYRIGFAIAARGDLIAVNVRGN